jgi:hypothetical protein
MGGTTISFKGVFFVAVAASCTTLALPGCGPASVDNLPRQAVSGKVTLDGAPLARGTIQFTPTTDLPTPAMVSINAGSYSIPEAQGLVPGTYKVSIQGGGSTAPLEKFGEMPGKAHREQAEAADKKQRVAMFGKAGASPVRSIPARYNTDTELTAEVKDRASNDFDFALSSGPTPKK